MFSYSSTDCNLSSSMGVCKIPDVFFLSFTLMEKEKKKKRLMPDEIPTFVEVWFISAGNFYRWEKNCWKLVKLLDVNYYRIKNINKILCVKLVKKLIFSRSQQHKIFGVFSD